MENLFNERVNNPQSLNLSEMVNINGGAGPYTIDPGILDGSTGRILGSTCNIDMFYLFLGTMVIACVFIALF